MKKKVKKVRNDSVDDEKKDFVFTEIEVELEKNRIEAEKANTLDLDEDAFGGDRKSS